ncbi:hypothetical protein B296_00049742 [Ensete ventricosum]|uniref:Uncharacterized protein n=1 Tax=Ensete ventricosum TaxID=4639 RepID=A0A426Y7G6_ENSVE|nr:hypothetical protein B296_00049742 [Ensete ventricosum]
MVRNRCGKDLSLIHRAERLLFLYARTGDVRDKVYAKILPQEAKLATPSLGFIAALFGAHHVTSSSSRCPQPTRSICSNIKCFLEIPIQQRAHHHVVAAAEARWELAAYLTLQRVKIYPTLRPVITAVLPSRRSISENPVVVSERDRERSSAGKTAVTPNRARCGSPNPGSLLFLSSTASAIAARSSLWLRLYE